MKIRRPVLTLSGGQLKSLDAGRQVARGIGLIESAWGIHSVRITLAGGCFVCADVDWRQLNGTPEERLLRSIIMDLERQKTKINCPPWEPPFWYDETLI